MIFKCTFCESRDISRVVPGLSVDLQSAIDTGVVLDTGVVEEYNNIESSSSVHTRVRDVFQSIELEKAYLSAGKLNPSSNHVGSTEHVAVSTGSTSAPTQSE